MSRKPAKQRGEKTVAVLDVGSSKVAALIALVGPDEDVPRVIGMHQLACTGMKSGLVADLAAVESAVRQAMDKAERNAGVTVRDVAVSVSAGGLESDLATVEVDIGGQRIERADLDHVHDEARAGIEPEGRIVLHAEPALYTLDGQNAVINPLGLHAETLAVSINILSAERAPMQNLEMAVRSADLNVTSKIAAPVAAARACLSAQEKALGVALVDLGAGRTNIAIFAQGLMVGFSSIAMGGEDVTQDVASALGTPPYAAERLKALKGSASAVPRDNHERIDVPGLQGGDSLYQRPRAELVHAIRGRLDVLFALIDERFEELGFVGPRARQVVLAGGGAALAGIADYAEGILGRNVRIGAPSGLTGFPEQQQASAFNVLTGLALMASEDQPDFWQQKTTTFVPAEGSGLSRMWRLLKQNI
ncbi:cell division protein FtsA [Pacificimonas sp. WHA3]|uniref:Cell division protein FtsA n=1 Tax=Pacificimonas pallii TaxID=2827236 RepID=A0ABS6SG25_9SPHN|nr:cell division protein FtsA [Pacificimonas pallii]MBV7257205.1 cell division protein FtsA [Pacificimonas pallii]